MKSIDPMSSSRIRRSRASVPVLIAFALGLGLATSSEARADGPDHAGRCRETGDHVACTLAGVPAEAASPDTALELYTAECTKHLDQCYGLVAYAQRLLKKRDPARAAKVLEKGCDLKAPRACATLGAELEEGERGLPADAAKAARAYERACDAGHARSCLVLTAMIDDGRGTRRDPGRSQRLRARAEALEKAARRGEQASPADVAQDEGLCRKSQDASRCVAAAAVLQETDAVKAEELFRIGCTADKASCGLWGFAVERFRRDDPARGTRLLEEGCGAGTALACVVLADLNHSGFRSVTRNEQRAAELYEKACNLGDPAGCRVTASRFRGVKNAPKADELAARAFTLEAEADKASAAALEKWLSEVPQTQARDAYVKELERRRAEWRAMALRAKGRWDLRMQRLAEIEAGSDASPLPPAPPEAAEASAARAAAIKRMAKALFP